MNTLQDGTNSSSKQLLRLNPSAISIASLVIALGSLSISALEWWDSHRQAIAQETPNVSFVESTNTDDPVVGLKIMNDGPGVAKLAHLKYFVDRKPLDNVTEAMDFGNLSEDAVSFTYDNDSTMAAGEQEWLLSMKTRVKGSQRSDLGKFADFVEKRFSVEAEVCSTITNKCYTICSRDGWCE